MSEKKPTAKHFARRVRCPACELSFATVGCLDAIKSIIQIHYACEFCKHSLSGEFRVSEELQYSIRDNCRNLSIFKEMARIVMRRAHDMYENVYPEDVKKNIKKKFEKHSEGIE